MIIKEISNSNVTPVLGNRLMKDRSGYEWEALGQGLSESYFVVESGVLIQSSRYTWIRYLANLNGLICVKKEGNTVENVRALNIYGTCNVILAWYTYIVLGILSC